MRIRDFAVEQWMNAWEDSCTINVAETYSKILTLEELFSITGTDLGAWLADFSAREIGYGEVAGDPELVRGICSLYRTAEPGHVITTHGATGANMSLLTTMCGPGTRVVTVIPTYQQLYSIPEMCGADVGLVRLRRENDYHLDPEDLRAACGDHVDVICVNNPDNPTGALMTREEMDAVVEIAAEHDAWLLADEAYRPLTQSGDWQESFFDLYGKCVAVSTMSKAWGLPGLRLGWLVTRDEGLRCDLLSHHDYDHICCGVFDEAVAAHALAHKDAILARNGAIVRQNLRILREWVDSEPHLSLVTPEAGTLCLVHFDFDMDGYEFCRGLLDTTGALASPGECFEEPRSIRVGFAYTDDPDELRRSLAAISEYVRGLA